MSRLRENLSSGVLSCTALHSAGPTDVRVQKLPFSIRVGSQNAHLALGQSPRKLGKREGKKLNAQEEKKSTVSGHPGGSGGQSKYQNIFLGD